MGRKSRLKERSLASKLRRTLMSQATYRGCKYNTDTPKQEYQKWYSETHAPAHPANTYRGVAYRPCHNEGVAK